MLIEARRKGQSAPLLKDALFLQANKQCQAYITDKPYTECLGWEGKISAEQLLNQAKRKFGDEYDFICYTKGLGLMNRYDYMTDECNVRKRVTALYNNAVENKTIDEAIEALDALQEIFDVAYDCGYLQGRDDYYG